MEYFLESVIGAIVWTFANVLYFDLRQKGIKRGRILSFVVGWPLTLFTAITTDEGRIERIEGPPDDEDRLLREIRVDRELRDEGSGGEAGRGTLGAFGGEEPEAPPGV